jgi:hypothetical protein
MTEFLAVAVIAVSLLVLFKNMDVNALRRELRRHTHKERRP